MEDCKDKVVYFHKRNDTNEVFYVGIGDVKRPYDKKDRNNYWNNTVKKVGYTIEIIHEGVTWEEAKYYEVKYIKDFGRKDLGLGLLVNMTDGGEGTQGLVRGPHTKEWKENVSKKLKGRIITKEVRDKIRQSTLGEKGHNSKVTKEQVLKIRRLYSEGNISQYKLGKMFNLSRGGVYDIIKRNTWSHI